MQSDIAVSVHDCVLYAIHHCETFGKSEGYAIPLLRPSDAARIAERYGAEDGKAIVQELRDNSHAKLDPQGRLRSTPSGVEARADALTEIRLGYERQCLAERESARQHFLSLFDGKEATA